MCIRDRNPGEDVLRGAAEVRNASLRASRVRTRRHALKVLRAYRVVQARAELALVHQALLCVLHRRSVLAILGATLGVLSGLALPVPTLGADLSTVVGARVHGLALLALAVTALRLIGLFAVLGASPLLPDLALAITAAELTTTTAVLSARLWGLALLALAVAALGLAGLFAIFRAGPLLPDLALAITATELTAATVAILGAVLWRLAFLALAVAALGLVRLLAILGTGPLLPDLALAITATELVTTAIFRAAVC